VIARSPKTFSGQFTKDPNVHFASLGGALSLEATCDTSGAVTVQVVGGEVATGSFYGWGTNWDGMTFQRATLVRTPGGTPSSRSERTYRSQPAHLLRSVLQVEKFPARSVTLT
jgi:hypothetical protein